MVLTAETHQDVRRFSLDPLERDFRLDDGSTKRLDAYLCNTLAIRVWYCMPSSSARFSFYFLKRK